MYNFLFFSNNKIEGGVHITFKYRYRKQIIIGVVIFIILAASSFFLYNKLENKKTISKAPTLLKKKIEEKEETIDSIEDYKVDIKGQIALPGIYSLKKDSRVIDVIEKAGGLTENADTSVINLSKKIQDEMVIIIYSREEVATFKETKEIEKQVQTNCLQKEENTLRNDACITTSSQLNGKISINTATLDELMTLKGIGESKAQDIIAYRQTNGPFQTIEEIMNVPGIGESRFAAIKEDITV